MRLTSLTVTLALLAAASPAAGQARHVVINQVVIPEQDLRAYEQRWNSRVPDGEYWYDRVSGAWGKEGGPTAGLIAAGLPLGGPLRADASRGNTGVFINGRELPWPDVTGLMQIVQVQRGRWWVDAQGNFGPENGPVWGNLAAIARQKNQKQWSAYSKDGHTFIGGDGNCSYFSSHDMSTSTDYSYASPGC
ncbi:MAG: hypothetical protein U0133_08440 [Gemmatimonadales bacterium]